ncbi:MAG: galactose-1-phosphate uridylyltransferase [Candidatus Pacebacteria bacterium]|nr:galactose-1-phosphate uridylyltransferase [Candidatus Paceibacterota bacterium]
MKKIKSEIRKDYLFNDYVIITPSRSKRPRDVKPETGVSSNSNNCPFCPKNLNQKNIIDIVKKGKKDWQAISIENIFPAVTLNNSRAYGQQEVIIETPKHDTQLGELNLKEIKALLNLYQKRTKKIAENKKINYILIFKNQGAKAGASLKHSHSQVFATKIIPHELSEEASLTQDYLIKNRACPYCDIIKKELKTPRKIFEDKHFAVIAPFASKYHYEAWVLPKRHLDNISLLTNNELDSLAKCLKLILSKLKKDNLDYNFFLHNVVPDKNQHFYIKIQPRDSVWAGVELGSGLVINSVSPEQAAKYYKKNAKKL